MNDSKKVADDKDKLKLSAPQRIVLKKTVEEGSIKQSFAHGRSKRVAVEVQRKKTFISKLDADAADASAIERNREARQQAGDAMSDAGGQRAGLNKGGHHVLRPLTQEEREAFQREQEELRLREAAAKAVAEAAAKAAAKAAAETAAKAAAEAAAKAAAEVGKAATSGVEPVAAKTDKTTEPVAAKVEKVAEPVAAKVADPADSVRKPEPVVSKGPEAVAAVEVKPGAVSKPGGVVAAERRGGKPTSSEGGSAPPVVERVTAVAKPSEEFVAVNRGGGFPRSGGQQGGQGARGPASAPAARAATPGATPAPEAAGDDDDKKGNKRKLSRSQREDVARVKSEELVQQRLAQVEELRKLKLRDEKRRLEVGEGEAEGVVDGKRATKSRGKRRDVAKSDSPLETMEGMSARRFRPQRGRKVVVQQQPLAPVVREVVIPEAIMVGELANRMAVKSSEVIKLLFKQGIMVTVNQVVDQETAVLLVEEMGHKAKPFVESASVDAEVAEVDDLETERFQRPPVVTVMGHVDHGKTSLLDAIRKTDVTAHEFGGITQHIGAYQVTTSSGARITFLDTPGHAAFTTMRSRGAKVTDLVVLVVAADDGVMPQTTEAINHARAAKVPILVAINKMDKPEANPERIMQQLTDYELVSEDWGGETVFVRVSAKTGEGLATLEEMIILQSEMLDLKANPAKRGRGTIIEAKLDKGRGPVATCLVQNGTLNLGDVVVAGSEWGRVRVLVNDKGERVKGAGPAEPVEIIGLSGVPEAGDELVVVLDEHKAREISEFRLRKLRERQQAKPTQANLGDLFDQIKQGEANELKVVIKADVRGSAEAVTEALEKITHDKVKVTVIHTGVGALNESDVMLALASKAIIVAFNVRAGAEARELAEREGVELRFYNIIYDVVDDVKSAMTGMLSPAYVEVVSGHARVKEVFRVGKFGNVAGCIITSGTIQRDSMVRLLRDNVAVYHGSISSLRHFKDDVKEVREGMECGIGLERYQDIKTNDVIEAFTKKEVKQIVT